MNANYFFSLYWRNIKGTFFGGFVPAPSSFGGAGAFFIWLGHIALLPLTLTLGAGLKTIFDCCTRRYTRDERLLRSVEESIPTMTNDQMGQLILELNTEAASCLGKKYSSNSSRWLFSRLSTDEHKKQEEDRLKTEQNRDAMIELCRGDRMAPSEIRQRYTEEYLKEFASKYEVTGRSYTTVKAGLDQSKTSLLSYMQNQNNNGKKLFQRVIGFFQRISQNVTKETTSAEKTQLAPK